MQRGHEPLAHRMVGADEDHRPVGLGDGHGGVGRGVRGEERLHLVALGDIDLAGQAARATHLAGVRRAASVLAAIAMGSASLMSIGGMLAAWGPRAFLAPPLANCMWPGCRRW